MQIIYPQITDYYSQSVIDGKLTTLSGNLTATISGVAGSVTLSGVSGIITSKNGNIWFITGPTLSGINGIVTSMVGNTYYISQNLTPSGIPYSVGWVTLDGSLNTSTTPATPVMSSYNAPSPYVVFDNGYSQSAPGWQAFDQNVNTYYEAPYQAPPWTLGFDFSTPQFINKYRIQNRTAYTDWPKDWQIQGSNDNQSWDVLHSVTSSTNPGNSNWTNWYTFTVPKAYRYYRWSVTSSYNGWYMGVAELQFVKAISTSTPTGALPTLSSVSNVQQALDYLSIISVSGTGGLTTTYSGYIWTVNPSGLRTYIDAQDTTISGVLKSYIDAQIASTISYVNSQDTATSGTLRSYVDTLSGTLRSYIDSQDTLSSGTLRSYINSQIASLHTYVDNSLTTASAAIVAQIPSVVGEGGINAYQVGTVWHVDGSAIQGGGGGSSLGGSGGTSTVSGVAGEDLYKYSVVYHHLDGKYYNAFSNGQPYQADAVGIVTNPLPILAGETGEITLEGPLTNITWNWQTTSGTYLYVGETPGSMTQQAPTVSGYIKPVAEVIDLLTIWFRPDVGFPVNEYAGVQLVTNVPVPGPPGATGSGIQGEQGIQGIQGIPGPAKDRYTITGRAGEVLPQYSVVYQDYGDNGRYKLAESMDLAKTDACGLVTQSGGINLDSYGEITLWGAVPYSGPGWLSGKPIYLSELPGGMTQTPSGIYFKPLGRCTTSSGIWWQPELGWLNETNSSLFLTVISGTVLQVKQAVKTDTYALTSNQAWVDIPGLSVSITPSSSASQILVEALVNIGDNACTPSFRIVRGSTPVGIGDASASRTQASFGTGLTYSDANQQQTIGAKYLDTPSGIATLTYKIQGAIDWASTAYINRSVSDTNAWVGTRTISSITVTEIGPLTVPIIPASQYVLSNPQALRPTPGVKGRIFRPTDGYDEAIDNVSSWDVYPVRGGIKAVTPPSTSAFNSVWANNYSFTQDLDSSLWLTQSGTGNGNEINTIFVQALPSAPYQLQVGMEIAYAYNANYTRLGIALTNGLSNPAMITFHYGSWLSGLGSTKFNYVTQTNSDYAVASPVWLQNRFFLRVRDDGSNRYSEYSLNGRNWNLVHVVGRTDFLTPTHGGIMVGQSAGSTSLSTTYDRVKIRLFHWYLGV